MLIEWSSSGDLASLLLLFSPFHLPLAMLFHIRWIDELVATGKKYLHSHIPELLDLFLSGVVPVHGYYVPHHSLFASEMLSTALSAEVDGVSIARSLAGVLSRLSMLLLSLIQMVLHIIKLLHIVLSLVLTFVARQESQQCILQTVLIYN